MVDGGAGDLIESCVVQGTTASAVLNAVGGGVTIVVFVTGIELVEGGTELVDLETVAAALVVVDVEGEVGATGPTTAGTDHSTATTQHAIPWL